MNEILIHQKYFTARHASCPAKTLCGQDCQPAKIVHISWLGWELQLVGVNSWHSIQHITTYTVHHNIMYYIILSTDLPDGEITSDQDVTHSGTLGAKMIHFRPSQVHQDILRTIGHLDIVICQVLDPIQQIGRNTGQKKTCSIMYIYHYCN